MEIPLLHPAKKTCVQDLARCIAEARKTLRCRAAKTEIHLLARSFEVTTGIKCWAQDVFRRVLNQARFLRAVKATLWWIHPLPQVVSPLQKHPS